MVLLVLLYLLSASFRLAHAEALPEPGPYARQVDVYLFWRSGCPHCERERDFLARISLSQPAVRVHEFNIWEQAAHRALLQRVGMALAADVSAVPLTVVGGQVFSGYLSDETTGREIELRVLECLARDCPDPVAVLMREPGHGTARAAPPIPPRGGVPPVLTLPLVGEVATGNLSLPALTLLLAALDGFNPCAMWTLVMLLGILVGIPDKRRRWALGGAFIGASALVYFLFMAAWLNVFLFLGMLPWVRVGVGLLALAGGGYYLRQFALRRDAVCEVSQAPRRRQVLDRLRELARRNAFGWALAGIIGLAFAVNLIELFCSAGIPAVYTRVLTLSALPPWQYYAYLLLYIAVFMLDDLIVFFATMKALELTGLGTRYARWSHLIGGLVLLGIGALLLLKPEWLVFG
jgi:glutaredoxin